MRPRRGVRTAAGVAVAAAMLAAPATVPATDAPAATQAPAEVVPLAWRAVPVFGSATIRTLRRRFGTRAFAEVLRINRIDAEHAATTDTLIVPAPSPAGPAPAAFVAPAPFPARVTGLDSLAKVVIVSLRIQALAAYESGRLVHWGPISSGGPGAPTRPGLFHVNWKLPVHRSTVDTSWAMPWCVNIDNWEGTALHQHPLPGHPASHCCIRLLEDDARWVYDWVEEWRLSPDGDSVLAPGTPVVLVGEWDFAGRRPWRGLPADPFAANATAAEITKGLQMAGPERLEKSP